MQKALFLQFRSVSVVFLVAVLCLSGCASKYGAQTTPVNAYPQCYRPIADLRADEENINKTTGGGAIAGALLGALIGGLATGKPQGALVGAVAGGATGAVAGHAYGTSQANKRGEQLARYVEQMDGESAKMDRTTAAARTASLCYDEQFRLAVAAFKAGRMDKLEFTRRYEEIRAGLEETSRLLTSAATDMAEKDTQYRQVLLEEQQLATAANRSPSQSPAKVAAKKQQAQELQAVTKSTNKWSQSRDALVQQKQATEKQRLAYQDVLREIDV